MGRMSKEKGKRGEREAAAELRRLFGVEARRGVQYHGGPDSPDVIVDIPGIHFEIKRSERLRLYAALEQARSESRPGQAPVVLHRPNGKPWVVIARLEDLPQIATRLFLVLAETA